MAKYERFAFNKLAVGGLPAKLEKEGCRVAYHMPTLQDLLMELPRKLHEECEEVAQAIAQNNLDEICRELADVVEVLLAMHAHPSMWPCESIVEQLAYVCLVGYVFDLCPAQIEAARQAKRALKGGLDEAIYLEYADVPLDAPDQQIWLAQFRADPAKYLSLGLVDEHGCAIAA